MLIDEITPALENACRLRMEMAVVVRVVVLRLWIEGRRLALIDLTTKIVFLPCEPYVPKAFFLTHLRRHQTILGAILGAMCLFASEKPCETNSLGHRC